MNVRSYRCLFFVSLVLLGSSLSAAEAPAVNGDESKQVEVTLGDLKIVQPLLEKYNTKRTISSETKKLVNKITRLHNAKALFLNGKYELTTGLAAKLPASVEDDYQGKIRAFVSHIAEQEVHHVKEVKGLKEALQGIDDTINVETLREKLNYTVLLKQIKLLVEKHGMVISDQDNFSAWITAFGGIEEQANTYVQVEEKKEDNKNDEEDEGETEEDLARKEFKQLFVANIKVLQAIKDDNDVAESVVAFYKSLGVYQNLKQKVYKMQPTLVIDLTQALSAEEERLASEMSIVAKSEIDEQMDCREKTEAKRKYKIENFRSVYSLPIESLLRLMLLGRVRISKDTDQYIVFECADAYVALEQIKIWKTAVQARLKNYPADKKKVSLGGMTRENLWNIVAPPFLDWASVSYKWFNNFECSTQTRNYRWAQEEVFRYESFMQELLQKQISEKQNKEFQRDLAMEVYNKDPEPTTLDLESLTKKSSKKLSKSRFQFRSPAVHPLGQKVIQGRLNANVRWIIYFSLLAWLVYKALEFIRRGENESFTKKNEDGNFFLGGVDEDDEDEW